MKKQGKRYTALKKQIPDEKQEISDALKICKETANAKFDESIELFFPISHFGCLSTCSKLTLFKLTFFLK